MLGPVATANMLDEPDGALDCAGRVVFEPEREREEEERLGVGDVEMSLVPTEGELNLSAEEAVKRCDENRPAG